MLPLINGPQTSRAGPAIPLYFIRHADAVMDSTDPNKDRAQGWLNVGLTDKGRENAKVLGEKLKTGDKPAFLVSSDLKRAVETANILRQIAGIPIVETSHFLRPWDLGSWVGELNTELTPKLMRLASKSPDYRTPKGKTPGESFDEFRQRFKYGLKLIFSKYHSKPGVVSHSRNEQLLRASRTAGWPPDGSIDINEFGRKCSPLGEMQIFDIPIRWFHDMVRRAV